MSIQIFPSQLYVSNQLVVSHDLELPKDPVAFRLALLKVAMASYSGSLTWPLYTTHLEEYEDESFLSDATTVVPEGANQLVRPSTPIVKPYSTDSLFVVLHEKGDDVIIWMVETQRVFVSSGWIHACEASQKVSELGVEDDWVIDLKLDE